MPPKVAVRDISFFERHVPFTKPFRFGAVVINAAAQAFVRVEIEVEGKSKSKSTSVGASAELMAPKWFDKRSQLTPEQTVEELRRSLGIARDLNKLVDSGPLLIYFVENYPRSDANQGLMGLVT